MSEVSEDRAERNRIARESAGLHSQIADLREQVEQLQDQDRMHQERQTEWIAEQVRLEMALEEALETNPDAPPARWSTAWTELWNVIQEQVVAGEPIDAADLAERMAEIKDREVTAPVRAWIKRTVGAP